VRLRGVYQRVPWEIVARVVSTGGEVSNHNDQDLLDCHSTGVVSYGGNREEDGARVEMRHVILSDNGKFFTIYFGIVGSTNAWGGEGLGTTKNRRCVAEILRKTGRVF